MLSKYLKRFFTSFGFYLLTTAIALCLITAFFMYLVISYDAILVLSILILIFILMCLFLAHKEAVEEIAYGN